MIAGIPAEQFLSLAAALVLAGGLTGILAGLFGVGGGAIIVPILYQTLLILGVPDEVRMPLTVGTSLTIIIPTSIRSYLAHRAKGAVDMRIVRLWAPPIFFRRCDRERARGLRARLAVQDRVRCHRGRQRHRAPDRRKDWRIADESGTWPMRAIGFLIGILSSLMGISGGMLSNITLMMFGRTIHQAVATSAGLGVIISIPGAIGYMLAGLPKMNVLPPLSLGFVSLIGFALLAPLGMLLSPVGARLAHAISRRRLEIAFGSYLLLMATRFAVNLF